MFSWQIDILLIILILLHLNAVEIDWACNEFTVRKWNETDSSFLCVCNEISGTAVLASHNRFRTWKTETERKSSLLHSHTFNTITVSWADRHERERERERWMFLCDLPASNRNKPTHIYILLCQVSAILLQRSEFHTFVHIHIISCFSHYILTISDYMRIKPDKTWWIKYDTKQKSVVCFLHFMFNFNSFDFSDYYFMSDLKQLIRNNNEISFRVTPEFLDVF